MFSRVSDLVILSIELELCEVVRRTEILCKVMRSFNSN